MAALGDAMQQRLVEVRAELERLRSSVELVKTKLHRDGLSAVEPPRRELGPVLRTRKTLRGHMNRVTAVDWSGDSVHLLSCSQDGKMIIWNALTNHKMQGACIVNVWQLPSSMSRGRPMPSSAPAVISLKSSWVMTCAYEQTSNALVACGGLDNTCTLYNTTGDSARIQVGPKAQRGRLLVVFMSVSPPPLQAELRGHEGYVSSVKFVAGTHMLTASGDSTCLFWDIARPEAPLARFTDHSSDVMSVAPCPSNPSLFVSGSTDATAKTWDLRTGRCTQTFVDHESDINAVAYMRHGMVRSME